VNNRADYESTLQALGLCVSARVPFLLWGDPGEGKTAVIESARASGWHVETLIVSHHEPTDFAGLPVIGPDGSVLLSPPAWARRLANCGQRAIAFFDEWTTAAPAVQAAALRPLTHYEVGDLKLPDTVSFGAAANPTDVATAGWELAPPTANRFCHLDWEMPLEVFAECLVTGSWPQMPVYDSPLAYAAELASTRVLAAGYLRARWGQLKAIPADVAGRGRAFPTPRTWDYATQLIALGRAVGARPAAVTLVAAGTIGAATAHEFMVWADAQDLPDPEFLLADPDGADLSGMRADRTYVVLQAILAAFLRKPTAQRWADAIRVCAHAAEHGNLDAAVPVVRALVRDGTRPIDAQTPAEIKVFAAPLALAGLLPKSGA